MPYFILKPTVQYIPAIERLINHYVQSSQELLPRSQAQILQALRSFWIACDHDDRVIGCVSLHLWANYLAEIKSLAVQPAAQGLGIGKKLVHKCLEDAKELGCSEVFALTFKPEFFYKLDFKITNRNNLPHKIWNECIHCPKLLECGETAVIYKT